MANVDTGGGSESPSLRLDAADEYDAAFEQAGAWNSFALALLKASQDCVKLVDLKGDVIAVNPAGVKILQFEHRDDIVGHAWASLWGETERAMVRDSVVAAVEGRSASFEGFCATAKGEPRWWRVTVVPVRDESGRVRCVLACSRDTTAQRQREHEMQDAIGKQRTALVSLSDAFDANSRKLRDAQARSTHDEKLKMFGRFVGSVVHDFNNVFAAVNGAARLLRRRVTEPSALEIVTHLERAVERGAGLSRQLLDYARDDGDAAEVFDPGATVARDAHLLRQILTGKATLAIHVAPDIWPVLGSPVMLQSVVFNLVANARDAMADRGEVEIAVTNCPSLIRPQGLDKADYVRICVRDNGVGMSPEAVQRAGEAFFTTKPKGKGTGLGLAAAFEFAANSGGRVFVHSAPGEGACIAVYLRRSPVVGDAEAAPEAEIEAEIEPGMHGGAKLLVVDDDTMLREHIAAVLRGLDYIVVEASACEIAAARAEVEADFDLVVTDLKLKDGLGDELVARLRVKQPNLPAIYVTGSAGVPVARDETVLRKPVSEARLARTVLRKLGRLPGGEAPAAVLRRVERIRDKLRDPEMVRILSLWRDHMDRAGRAPLLSDEGPWRDAPPPLGYVVAMGAGVEPQLTFVKVGAELLHRLGRDAVGTMLQGGDELELGSVAKAVRRCCEGAPTYEYVRFAVGDGTVSTTQRLLLPLADARGHVKYAFGVVASCITPNAAMGSTHDS